MAQYISAPREVEGLNEEEWEYEYDPAETEVGGDPANVFLLFSGRLTFA